MFFTLMDTIVFYKACEDRIIPQPLPSIKQRNEGSQFKVHGAMENGTVYCLLYCTFFCMLVKGTIYMRWRTEFTLN